MRSRKSFRSLIRELFPFSTQDLLTTVILFACATGICALLWRANSTDGFAFPVYTLTVLLTSRLTTGYFYGFLASVLGVVCTNYIFTYPYWAVNFTLTGYPITFLVFLVASMMTCALTTQVRRQERLRAEGEKEAMRANLLRSVSHDIRTPLTSIVGSTSTVLENPGLSESERRELLEDTRNEAQWLIRMVENLLSITRIGGQTRITTSPEAAEEVLGEAVQKFARRYPAIRFSVSAPEELLIVPMDPILIEQVLSNLMESAVVHGKTTTEIHLTLRSRGNYAYFDVADNGQGISPKELPTLFDGTLKHNETPRGDGKRNMGLGLSVCMAIVRAHGGSLSARNLDQGGAEFTFRLPLYKEDS